MIMWPNLQFNLVNLLENKARRNKPLSFNPDTNLGIYNISVGKKHVAKDITNYQVCIGITRLSIWWSGTPVRSACKSFL